MNNDIRLEFSSVHTPEEMGIAERFNRTLLEKMRPMIMESKLPSTFWSFAVVQANYLYNRSPDSSLGEKAPFLVRFGCKVKRFIDSHRRGKLEM